MVEMRKAILAEVSTQEATMRKFYDGFITMHKAVVHLHGFQQWRKRFVQALTDIHATIAHVQKWTMRYEGAPLYLPKIKKAIGRDRQNKGLDVDPKLLEAHSIRPQHTNFICMVAQEFQCHGENVKDPIN